MWFALAVACRAPAPAPDASGPEGSGVQAADEARRPATKELASARIVAVGDTMMHGMVQRSAEDASVLADGVSTNHGGYDALWDAVVPRIRGADLAFTNGRGPRLHHIGVWTAGALDILHICDVMATSGYLANMERGPGRHGIANAFFLYVRDPDGHRVELFTSDYLTVDTDHEPIRWTLDNPQRQTLWGHPAPKSWFEEGSPFTGVPVREPVLAARPVVAR